MTRQRLIGWVFATLLTGLVGGGGLGYWLESGNAAAEFVPAVAPVVSSPIRLTYSGSGTFQVPAQIVAGTYVITAGAGDFGCYWERLRSFDGRKASVLSSGNASRGAYGRLVVTASDRGVRMAGDCVWVKI